jgi:ribonucleoside-diphosphate reductase alpha chain
MREWSDYARRVYKERYSFNKTEEWPDTCGRVPTEVFSPVIDRRGAAGVRAAVERLMLHRRFMPGGRYLYSAGRPLHQVANCLMCLAKDSREGWAEHYYKHVMGLSTGAGIGSVYSLIRPKGAPLGRGGGTAGGPLNLAVGINEAARTVRQGGDRRAALWAGLHWWHEDVMPFVEVKNWSEEVRAAKARDFNSPGPMDYTNHSVCLDDAFFEAIAGADRLMGDIRLEARGRTWGMGDDLLSGDVARRVYWAVIRDAMERGNVGLSVDRGKNAREWLRNACTELTSADPDDICNIGSINLGECDTIDEFAEAVESGTVFLLAGSVYGDLPYADVGPVREKNRRLGLGLMGIHEWLIKRGLHYGPNAELGRWLEVYARSTEIAHRYADAWGISRPVKTRAVAPTGTISIVAETTSGIEPILAVAYKRRVKKGDETWAQYVVDPVARRLIDGGADPKSVESAYTMAESREGIERRVAFQAWVQRYVDHGISSTLNMPQWGSPNNNEGEVQWFGEMLLKYLPHLRGITVYPDGAQSGQPMTAVPYEVAIERGPEVVFEQGEVCELTKGGICSG